jgi:phospho-N-acetylmuramoyl-pentapeptide-transferase
MFCWVLERLANGWPGHVEALGKITFRASLAAAAAFLLALLLGPRLIAWLAARFREPIKSDSAEVRRLHESKQATPTMGGLFIVAGLVGALLAFGDLASPQLHAALVTALGLAAVGAVDDLVKLRGRGNGLPARAKLVGQLVVCSAAAAMLYRHYAGLPGGLLFRVPLVGVEFSLGAWFVPWAVLVMVGTSNAVNLTDGLDGLAGGSLVFATAAMTAAAYAAGHAELAEYLNVPRIAGAGELAVLGAAMIGGVLGFLWFNCHPAQVFMGDTGSLPLGGLLGLLAIAARQELLLVVVGGVFVAEAGSVILQVGWYKWTRRRILRCAPLHHHFQFLGWPETRIVTRFWIASALCALVGLAALKLQVHEKPTGDQPTARWAQHVSMEREKGKREKWE